MKLILNANWYKIMKILKLKIWVLYKTLNLNNEIQYFKLLLVITTTQTQINFLSYKKPKGK